MKWRENPYRAKDEKQLIPTLEYGDKIRVSGIIRTVSNTIFYQDNGWMCKKNNWQIDIEGLDANGNYFNYKSACDGGMIFDHNTGLWHKATLYN